MKVRAALVVALLFGVSTRALAGGLDVVDDRGRSISASLQACFTKGLDTRCVDTRPWLPPAGFEQFDSATIEGPDHGPTELTIATARRVIVVPRKASLLIHDAPSNLALRASIYYRDDPSFRRPAKDFVVASELVKVPARPLLLALQGSGESAPFLSLLSPKPAETYTVNFRASPGWALLVRSLESGGKRPVAAAKLKLMGTTVAGEASPIGSADSASDGLAIFEPITLAFVGVRGQAQGFLESSIQGVGTSKGKFEFRELPFDRGGDITARVSIDGQPGIGAMCQIVSMRASSKPRKGLAPESDVFGAARTDASGVCKISGIREGVYLFRVLPEDGGAGTDEVVAISEGRNLDDEVELERITISGKVRRADKPVAGATIIAASASDLPNGSGRTTFPIPMMAKTNEDGEYKGFVWAPGQYSLELMPTSALVGAADKTLYVSSAGATVDFDLSDTMIRGVVTDQDGKQIENARVVLSQTVGGDTNSRRAQSDQEGKFEYSVDGKGQYELKASKLGYKSSESVAVPVSEGAETPETSLVITKLNTITGRIVGPGGVPVPNVTVGSYSTGVPVRQGRATSDGDGRFEIERSLKGATRLFSTGSGCALQVTDVGESAEEVQINCSPEYAGANLTLRTAPPDSEPLQDEWIWLRVNGVVVPRDMMLSHCAAYGISCTTAGDGKMAIIALPPGEYDLYLGQAASDYTIYQGMKDGYMGSFSAAANSMSDLEFEIKYGAANEGTTTTGAK